MQKTSPSYTEVQRLRREQLKCPYCRNVQVGLLPRRKGFVNVDGVNTPYKFIMKRQKCKYVFQSGKRKGKECGVASVDRFCVKCHKLYEKRKSKCVKNDKVVSGKKLKTKIRLVTNDTKNDVISKSNINDVGTKCCAILKTGINAGKKCSRNAKFDGMCGFHKKKE